MGSQNLTSTGLAVEAYLSGSKLDDFLRQQSLREIETRGASASQYEIFAVRRNEQADSEIFGPKNIHVGTYSEEELYGAVGSPLLRFRSAMEALKSQADHLLSLNPEDVEHGYRLTIFWSDVGRLKEFIGVSSPISEMVAELRTARFQFRRKDTPLTAIKALASALRLVVQAKRFDTPLVDKMVEILSAGDFDSLAQDSLRDSDG